MNEETIQNNIYVIRGQKAMIDFEPAVRQSKALIRTFKAMKDYIVENQGLMNQLV